jgi:2,3-bisphosphoglycerate-independent phosphoglycerate mutase
MARPKPVILCILDGWGYNPSPVGNAIAMARKPNMDKLAALYPHTLIHTSGPYVGLPEGQMGNSEVGHLNMGAGRIIHMDITRLDLEILNGEFFREPLLLQAMERGRTAQLHLIGLVSDGGVHSHNTHLYALLRMAAEHKVERVFVHAFMDGRDTPPESGAAFLEALEAEMRRYGVGKIATVCGRYYAMDRDKRWERISRSYRAMVLGEGRHATSAVTAMKQSYEAGITDEFTEPVVITTPTGEPLTRVHDDDAVVFFNFRADRARQMTSALLGPALGGVDLPGGAPLRKNLFLVMMTQYNKTLNAPYVLQPQSQANILANVLANNHLRNMRIAETEKYAHVTYFFNGGNEKPYPGEERVMIPSPKVATYDLMPEMSAAGVAAAAVKAIDAGEMDCIVMNFANADMVGHSGKIPPTIKAVETVDGCIGGIYDAVHRAGGALIITADHGNAELMIDPVTGGPHTYHTTNPVPLILVSDGHPHLRGDLRNDGSLRDLAPTMLALMGLPQPAEMTGRDLRV